MPDPADTLETKLAPQVRTMQIVVLAMVVVPLIFAGVVLVIGAQGPENPAPIQGEMIPQRGGATMGRIALGFGLVAMLAQQLMGRYVTSQAVQNLKVQAMGEPERLGEAFMTGTVVSCAINEGAAFLNLIAYMASQSPYNLGMGLLLIASNAIKWPTLGKVAAWARMTAKRLKEERELKATR
ncbi:unnamed protein product [Ectocarpus sp. 4 AP-2014]